MEVKTHFSKIIIVSLVFLRIACVATCLITHCLVEILIPAVHLDRAFFTKSYKVCQHNFIWVATRIVRLLSKCISMAVYVFTKLSHNTFDISGISTGKDECCEGCEEALHVFFRKFFLFNFCWNRFLIYALGFNFRALLMCKLREMRSNFSRLFKSVMFENNSETKFPAFRILLIFK